MMSDPKNKTIKPRAEAKEKPDLPGSAAETLSDSEKTHLHVERKLQEVLSKLRSAKDSDKLNDQELLGKGIDPEALRKEASDLETNYEAVLGAISQAIESKRAQLTDKGGKAGRGFLKNNYQYELYARYPELKKFLGSKGSVIEEVSDAAVPEPALAETEQVQTSAEPLSSENEKPELAEKDGAPFAEPLKERRAVPDLQVEQLKLELVAARDAYAQIEATTHAKWERLKKFFGRPLKKDSPDLNEAKNAYQNSLRSYKDFVLEKYKGDNYQVMNLYHEIAEEYVVLYELITQKRADHNENPTVEKPSWKKKLEAAMPKVAQWLQEKKDSHLEWSQAILKPEFLEGRQTGMLSLMGKVYAQKLATYVETHFKPLEMTEEREKIKKDVAEFSYALAGGQIGDVEIRPSSTGQMAEMERKLLHVEQKEIAREKGIDKALDSQISSIDPKVSGLAESDGQRAGKKKTALTAISAVARPAIGTARAIERRLDVKREITGGSTVKEVIFGMMDEMLDEMDERKGLEKYYEKYGYVKSRGNAEEFREKLFDDLLVNFAKAYGGITHVLTKIGNSYERDLDRPIIEKGDTLSLRESDGGLRLILDKKNRYIAGDETTFS